MTAGQVGAEGQHPADSLLLLPVCGGKTAVVDGDAGGRHRHGAPVLEKLPAATHSGNQPSRVPLPAVGPRWPRPVHGAGLRDADTGSSGKLLAWLRMNLSFQKRALELKGAIQAVCWGVPCPQRGSGWAPERLPVKGRLCVPGVHVPEPGGGGGQLDTAKLSIRVGSGCLSLEG